jgi:hypothetical protein
MLLAWVAAVIDLLIKGGHDGAKAAQLIARRMLAAGVRRRKKAAMREAESDCSPGARSRPQHRLEAKDKYRDFTREIEAIPASERWRRVLDERLWDRRRKSR